MPARIFDNRSNPIYGDSPQFSAFLLNDKRAVSTVI
jgi:hypothetical protein